MSSVQIEAIIKKLIKEIAYECKIRGEDVLEPVITYMVKAVIINPENNFSPEIPLSDVDLMKLKEICLSKLVAHCSPTLDTMKMQVYFDLNFTKRAEFLEEHHLIIKNRLKPAYAALLGRIGSTQEELEHLYRSLISAILITSGIGSPTNIAVIREASTALQTFLPLDRITLFYNKKEKERIDTIENFTDIVSGMRIYNFSLGFGGEGIENIPELIEEAIKKTLETLNSELKNIERMAALYSSLYIKFTATTENFSDDGGVMVNLTSQEALKVGVDRDILLNATINARQHAAYLRKLRVELIESRELLDVTRNDLVKALASCMSFMKEHGSNSSDAQPVFAIVGRIWSKFQDQMVFLSLIMNVLNSLQVFSCTRHMKLTETMLMTFISDPEIILDYHRARNMDVVIPPPASAMKWSFPTKPYDNAGLALNGFCAWSLVRYHGLVIPSTPSIGVYLFNGNYYGFSSAVAAEEFEAKCEKFTFEINELVRKKTELVKVLGLEPMFASGRAFFKDKAQVAESKRMADSGSQTLVHPIERLIDRKYEWNEWELRRKAIQLARIRKCRTHSVQTILSNWRRDMCTQVWLPRENSSQTKRDNYSQVPKPSIFLHGLRGSTGVSNAFDMNPDLNCRSIYRMTDHTKVDLTIPIEEQLLGSINGPDRPMHW